MQDAGEPGIPGVTVDVFSVGPDGLKGTADDELAGSDVTDANGNYFVDGLRSGDYFVKINEPAPDFQVSSTPTDDADNQEDGDDNGTQMGGVGGMVMSPIINLAQDDEPTGAAEGEQGGDQDDADDSFGDMTVDFGFLPFVSVGSTVFVDNNDNGQQDAGEPGIEGVTVMVFNLGPDGIGENGDDELVGQDVTDGNGDYFVDGLLQVISM